MEDGADVDFIIETSSVLIEDWFQILRVWEGRRRFPSSPVRGREKIQ